MDYYILLYSPVFSQITFKISSICLPFSILDKSITFPLETCLTTHSFTTTDSTASNLFSISLKLLLIVGIFNITIKLPVKQIKTVVTLQTDQNNLDHSIFAFTVVSPPSACPISIINHNNKNK
jgi:hypothetical protein